MIDKTTTTVTALVSSPKRIIPRPGEHEASPASRPGPLRERRRRGMTLRVFVSSAAIVMAASVGAPLQGNHTERVDAAALQQTTNNSVVLDDAGIWPSGDAIHK